MRYQYVTAGNKIICISHYAGKPVRGIAKCYPTDEFNLEDGKKLAQSRCDYKIAQKRVRRARARHAEATKALDNAREYRDKMLSYYDESFRDFVRLDEELKALEAKMKH